MWTPDCVDAMARPWPHAMDATVGLAWRSRPVGTLVSGRHVVISPLVVDTEVANCGRQQLTFGLLLACLWLASGGLGHPSSDSSTSGPMPWRRRVGELSLWASRCILSCTWPQWRSAHVGRPLPCRTSTVPLRCLHCNRHCGGMRRHCDGERLGAAERRLERPIADDMMRLPHWRGIRARCHHARLRTTRTMGLSKQPEAASRRRRVLSALRRFGWIARCYACCPPLLTLKDNLHSRCAAISDYPSRPSSPADRWLYLLIGPLNLLGWRAPRAASGAPEAHRHTTPASALKQAPHWEPHTHMRRRREDRTLPVHTYNQRTLACKGRGGWVTRDCARLGRWG